MVLRTIGLASTRDSILWGVAVDKKVGGVLIKKALHIVTDATDLIYNPFRTWGFILMVRDLLLEDY